MLNSSPMVPAVSKVTTMNSLTSYGSCPAAMPLGNQNSVDTNAYSDGHGARHATASETFTAIWGCRALMPAETMKRASRINRTYS